MSNHPINLGTMSEASTVLKIWSFRLVHQNIYRENLLKNNQITSTQYSTIIIEKNHK